MKKLFIVICMLFAVTQASYANWTIDNVDKTRQDIEAKKVGKNFWFIQKFQIDSLSCDSIKDCQLKRSFTTSVTIVKDDNENGTPLEFAKDAYLNGTSQPIKNNWLKWRFPNFAWGFVHDEITNSDVAIYTLHGKTRSIHVRSIERTETNTAAYMIWLAIGLVISLMQWKFIFVENHLYGIIRKENDDIFFANWYGVLPLFFFMISVVATMLTYGNSRNEALSLIPSANVGYSMLISFILYCLYAFKNILVLPFSSFWKKKILWIIFFFPIASFYVAVYLVTQSITILSIWFGLSIAITVVPELVRMVIKKMKKRPTVST